MVGRAMRGVWDRVLFVVVVVDKDLPFSRTSGAP